MIGIIGPRDSVAQVMDVARHMRLDVPLLPRWYREPGDVVELTRELDAACSVLLYTGRVPFALAGGALTTNARLEYIPHEGIDLMRVLARLLFDSQRSEPPRVSLDSIDTVVAEEIFLELGLGRDRLRSIPLVLGEDAVGFSTTEIARRHQELVEAGQVDFCLTCLDSVYRWLQRHDVPAQRITHARMVIRSALERCVLETRLNRASAAQIAVALIAPSLGPETGGGRPFLVEALARDAAVQMDAELVDRSSAASTLVTTRGAVERWLGEVCRGDAKLSEADFVRLTDIGVGFGETRTVAEQHARRALTLARRERRPHVVRDDGAAVAADTMALAYQARVTETDKLRLSREIGLSPSRCSGCSRCCSTPTSTP